MSFGIFAAVVTVLYVIYFTVIIFMDLFGKPKTKVDKVEEFDNSDMDNNEEDTSTVVDEISPDGGYQLHNDEEDSTENALPDVAESESSQFVGEASSSDNADNATVAQEEDTTEEQSQVAAEEAEYQRLQRLQEEQCDIIDVEYQEMLNSDDYMSAIMSAFDDSERSHIVVENLIQ